MQTISDVVSIVESDYNNLKNHGILPFENPQVKAKQYDGFMQMLYEHDTDYRIQRHARMIQEYCEEVLTKENKSAIVNLFIRSKASSVA